MPVCSNGSVLDRDPLLAAKLNQPAPRPTLVRRERLNHMLSAGLAAPLTVVIAPAGWGKTSLLTGWLADTPEGVSAFAWLSLDAADGDLVRFLRYLIATGQAVEPGFGHAAIARLSSRHPLVIDAVLTALLNDFGALPRDTVLVLDDYHVIENPEVHRALGFFLERLPPHVHILVTARNEPPLPLARMRARGLLVEVRAGDLAFTEEEAVTFLKGAMKLDLRAEEIAELRSRTEGWIAGLHLAALTLRDQSPERRHDVIATLGGTQRFILDYLAGEVFDLQDPMVRRFLLDTSVLDLLTGPLCDAVTESGPEKPAQPSGQVMLERLDLAGLFIIQLDQTRTWYRYHLLFAEFLRARLQREAPELVPDLHRRAATWLEAHGRSIQAAEHALSAGDADDAARLIEQATGAMIWRRGEVVTLQRWLGRLPRDVTQARPRLSLDLAWALLWSAEIEPIHALLDDVEAALGKQDGSKCKAMLGEVAAIRAELARQIGRLHAAISMARRALADLPEEERLVRGVTNGLLAQALLDAGDAPGAAAAFAVAADLSQTPATLAPGLIARGRLVQAQALQGHLHLAASTYRQGLLWAQAQGVGESPAAGAAQVYMAEVSYEWDDRDAAEDLVCRGIALCEQWPGMAEMAVDGRILHARLLQSRREFEGAERTLAAAEALGLATGVTYAHERVAIPRARLFLETNEAAAARWASSWDTLTSSDDRSRYIDLLARIARARVHLVLGAPADAVELLDAVADRARAGSLEARLIEIDVLRALALHRLGRMGPAMTALARAMDLAEPEGYIRLFVDEGPRLVVLLREARNRGVRTEYVATLLGAIDTLGAVPAADQGLVEPLSPRELELLRLLASGLSTAEIAKQLFITVGTARNHLKSIYGKLDAHNRVQAVERARALKVL